MEGKEIVKTELCLTPPQARDTLNVSSTSSETSSTPSSSQSAGPSQGTPKQGLPLLNHILGNFFWFVNH